MFFFIFSASSKENVVISKQDLEDIYVMIAELAARIEKNEENLEKLKNENRNLEKQNNELKENIEKNKSEIISSNAKNDIAINMIENQEKSMQKMKENLRKIEKNINDISGKIESINVLYMENNSIKKRLQLLEEFRNNTKVYIEQEKVENIVNLLNNFNDLVREIEVFLYILEEKLGEAKEIKRSNILIDKSSLSENIQKNLTLENFEKTEEEKIEEVNELNIENYTPKSTKNNIQKINNSPKTESRNELSSVKNEKESINNKIKDFSIAPIGKVSQNTDIINQNTKKISEDSQKINIEIKDAKPNNQIKQNKIANQNLKENKIDQRSISCSEPLGQPKNIKQGVNVMDLANQPKKNEPIINGAENKPTTEMKKLQIKNEKIPVKFDYEKSESMTVKENIDTKKQNTTSKDIKNIEEDAFIEEVSSKNILIEVKTGKNSNPIKKNIINVPKNTKEAVIDSLNQPNSLVKSVDKNLQSLKNPNKNKRIRNSSKRTRR